MERAAYIIPGFSHRTTEPAYVSIAEAFAARGYQPVPIDIPWRRMGIGGYVRFACAQIAARPASDSVILGFSLGAMCAVAAAPELRPRAQILCSLMPLYAEDQPHQSLPMRAWAWRVYLGRRKVSYPDVDGQGWPPTTFIYGEREHRIIQQRVRDAREVRFPGAKTLVVPGARHAIANAEYLATVHDVIGSL